MAKVKLFYKHTQTYLYRCIRKCGRFPLIPKHFEINFNWHCVLKNLAASHFHYTHTHILTNAQQTKSERLSAEWSCLLRSVEDENVHLIFFFCNLTLAAEQSRNSISLFVFVYYSFVWINKCSNQWLKSRKHRWFFLIYSHVWLSSKAHF